MLVEAGALVAHELAFLALDDLEGALDHVITVAEKLLSFFSRVVSLEYVLQIQHVVRLDQVHLRQGDVHDRLLVSLVHGLFAKLEIDQLLQILRELGGALVLGFLRSSWSPFTFFHLSRLITQRRSVVLRALRHLQHQAIANQIHLEQRVLCVSDEASAHAHCLTVGLLLRVDLAGEKQFLVRVDFGTNLARRNLL